MLIKYIARLLPVIVSLIFWGGIKLNLIKADEGTLIKFIVFFVISAIISPIISYFLQTPEEKKTPSPPKEDIITGIVKGIFGEKVDTKNLSPKTPEWRAWLEAIGVVAVGFLIMILIFYLIYE